VRVAPVGEGLLERIALALNLVPVPAGYALFGQSSARALGVAQRLGVFGRLARAPATAEALADELGLQRGATGLLCEALIATGALARDGGGSFMLARRARRWLDPASPTYIGTWLEHSVSYWEWYGDLERIVRDGGSFEIHREPADDDAYWRVYITGQYELARLSAREVARAVRLPRDPRALLDLAGGHGWFAAEICRRHDRLAATVLDLEGSVAVGREIIAAAGLSERVSHRVGDMFHADLGGPYDGVLLFDILHHLDAEQTATLLARVAAALRPGGTVAVLDMFREAGRRPTAMGSTLGLFFHLTSGADLPDARRLAGLLHEAGFAAPRRTRLRRIPDQALYQAVKAS
jgi:ubiquinone/menaquinone biosynthesis C-methylase UbiE